MGQMDLIELPKTPETSQLCATLNIISGGYLLIDEAGTVVFVNEWLAERLPGEAPFIGQPFFAFVHVNRGARLRSAVRGCLVYNQAAFLSHYLNRQPFKLICPVTSEPIPHTLRVIPFPDPQTKTRMCLVEVQDVSLELEREAKLRKQAASLSELSEDLSHIVYAASHDLRTPVRNLSDILGMFVEDEWDDLSPDARGYVLDLQRATQRMRRLTDSLLDWTRLRKGPNANAVCDMGDVMAEVAADFEIELKRFDGSLLCGNMPKVRIEHVRAQRLMQNLIENAITYRSEDPLKISIVAIQDGDVVQFSIRDNGIGIAEEFHEKIFSLFSRLHSDADREGSGMGLPICQKIVEDAGGRIWAVPRDRGSEFRFTLSLVSEPTACISV